MPVIFLETERLYLRPLEESDLTSDYAQWLNDSDVCAQNGHAIFPYAREQLNIFYESVRASRDTVVLAIIERGNSQHIGNISLQAIDWVSRTAEFAILIGAKSFWGQGLAFEAARLMFDYGFQRLNLRRIHCGTFAGNGGMKALATKLGMQLEGVRRQAVFKNGEYVDVIEFGLLREEFVSCSLELASSS